MLKAFEKVMGRAEFKGRQGRSDNRAVTVKTIYGRSPGKSTTEDGQRRADNC